MNRYAAAGIATDAHGGRRILVVTRNQAEAHTALEVIAQHSDHAARVTRTNGNERIDYLSGGRVTIRSHRGHGHRGITADTIYLDEGVDPELTIDQAASLMACLATSPTGELIRA